MSAFLKYISAAGKLFFPSLLWKKSESSKILYLTFDDGPIPEITPWVLSILKDYNAKATFFCIGDNIRKHPEIFQQVLAEGHTIGNHTFNHLNGWKTSTEDYIQNVLLAEEAITEISNFQIPNPSVGRKIPNSNESTILRHQKTENNKQITDNLQLTTDNPQQKTTNGKQQTQNNKPVTDNLQPTTNNQKLFRPPYGRIKPSQIRELKRLGYIIAMWDVISKDYNQRISEEECFQEVVTQAATGSIIVFHDSEKASRNMMGTLPRILEFYKKQGYNFRSL